MKKQAMILLPVLCVLAGVAAASEDLAEHFANPPPSAKPWVYWFHLNGNQTKEGITADLEAMARVGIGGVLWVEVDQGAPKGPVDFAGPLWLDLFKHTCNEAHRLGLEINMNNGASWCGSGGPWITPELSMQKVVWSETIVEGGRKFEGVLTRPEAVRDFYRDITVLAIPVTTDEETVVGAHGNWTCSGITSQSGKFSLPKPEPKAPQFVQVAFSHAYTARQLTARLGGNVFQDVRGELQVSDDGEAFATVCGFHARPSELRLDFKPATGKIFRLVFDWLDGINADKLEVSDVDLSGRYRLANVAGKADYVPTDFASNPANFPVVPAGLAVSRDKIVDLSVRMDQDGKLVWDAPPGRWWVLRFGRTTTGKENDVAPSPGRGLECDKLSKEAAVVQFNNLMGRLIAENKPLSDRGKVLVSTHIDSWESDSQNWTPRMREEFRERRGYDILPFLPAFAGRVVDSVEVTERFLWDLRQTVAEMVVENYAGEFRRLANQHDLRLSIEAYSSVEGYHQAPVDEMTYGGQADEPQAEFWSWKPFCEDWSCTEMASAGHTYGRNIIAAEAFTALNSEKWQGHPAGVKDIGDWAFCEGINRFIIHRYAAQPWMNYKPGMSMGPWGLHYERTQTWWEQSKAWHQYLARCQYMLRQGLFVADVAYLQPEGAPRRFLPPADAKIAPHIRGGYNFDGCTPEVVLTRMQVKDGRIVLPDGMSYRVLVLPPVETMTPLLLRKIQELAAAGATILGASKPPQQSPSLADMGAGDVAVKRLADELWSGGKIITNKTASEWLCEHGVRPDFSATPSLRYIHRTAGNAEIYFVANPEPVDVEALASFRITGRQPEFWWPDTGRTDAAIAFEEKNGMTNVPLRLEPSGSVFVVFRRASTETDPIVGATRNGQPVFPRPQPKAAIVVQRARYGLLHDPNIRDVRAGVQALVDAGMTNFRAAEVAKGDLSDFSVESTLVVDYTVDGKPLTASARDTERLTLDASPAAGIPALDLVRREIWENGTYNLETASGRNRQVAVALPSPLEINGPWEVSFDPKWGGPDAVRFEKLDDWAKHPKGNIRYYSGEANYQKTFVAPAALCRPGPASGLILDLGKVAVMAEVKLNGVNLGIVWKPPFRVDVTGLLRFGENTLEVKVANLWINRQVGDEHLPEDSDRNPDGTVKAWPAWLNEGRSSPVGRYTFTSWRLWQKDDPLVESGLLGPVKIYPMMRLE